MSELPSPGSEVLDALYRGDSEALEARLATRPDLTIFEAAALGRVDRVRELVLLEPGFVDLWSPDGFTAVHLGAFFGHEAVVALLLQRGADPDPEARNALRVRPLHSAAAGNHTGIARLLLEHGADANARQAGGRFTPRRRTATTSCTRSSSNGAPIRKPRPTTGGPSPISAAPACNGRPPADAPPAATIPP